MRVLVYGAGVIGSLYGARLRQAGHEVVFLPRGRRLAQLRTVATILRAAGFEVAVSRRMGAWLTTHAVFVTPMRLLEAPVNLRLLYLLLPEGFAVRSWRSALGTELGRFGLAAHASAAREETAALAQKLRGIVGEPAAPALDAIFRRAGM